MSTAQTKTTSDFTEAAEWAKRITDALSMVAVGAILLLNTTGALPWSVWWEFIKFWPIFIISAGIGIMLSGSNVTKAIAEVINFLLFLAMMFFATVNTFNPANVNSGFPFFVTSSDNTVVQSAIVSEDEYPAQDNVTIEFTQGVGNLNINANTTDNSLFATQLTSNNEDSGFTLVKTVEKNAFSIKFESVTTKTMSFGKSGYDTFTTLSPKWQNIDLEIKLGAGTSNLNFTNVLNLGEIKLDNGAGETNIKIAADSVPEKMILHNGAGSIKINLPKEVGYEINYNVGVGSAKCAGIRTANGLGVHGNGKTENFATAEKVVSITADIGAGELVITQN